MAEIANNNLMPIGSRMIPLNRESGGMMSLRSEPGGMFKLSLEQSKSISMEKMPTQINIGEPVKGTEADRVREMAREFVALAFIEPMLKMSRESALKTDMFHGGFGEDMFVGELDHQVAMQIASDDQSGLVKVMVERYARTDKSVSQLTNGVDIRG